MNPLAPLSLLQLPDAAAVPRAGARPPAPLLGETAVQLRVPLAGAQSSLNRRRKHRPADPPIYPARESQVQQISVKLTSRPVVRLVLHWIKCNAPGA